MNTRAPGRKCGLRRLRVSSGGDSDHRRGEQNDSHTCLLLSGFDPDPAEADAATRRYRALVADGVLTF